MSETQSPLTLLEVATAGERSKVMFALIELQIPTWLATGPLSATAIAERLGADPLAIDRFLTACTAVGLLVREGDLFHNAESSERFLVRESDAYLGDALLRYERMTHSVPWSHFVKRLLTWRAGGSSDRVSREGGTIAAENEGEHRLSVLAGDALASALDLSGNRCVLDLGGGTGGMSIALCRRFPALRAIVVDRPAVARLALAHVSASGLADRIHVQDGDFLVDPLPGRCDVALLANVLSMLSPETNRVLLGRVFDYLPNDGRIVLSGWMLDDDRAGPALPALLSLEDVILGAPDVERRSSTYAAWLGEAGFVAIERRAYFEPFRLVLGRKRASNEPDRKHER
jgi:SAM-dependent methyltransferase